MGKNIQVRTFKTEWFAKQAIKANILDGEVCVAIELRSKALLEICHEEDDEEV